MQIDRQYHTGHQGIPWQSRLSRKSETKPSFECYVCAPMITETVPPPPSSVTPRLEYMVRRFPYVKTRCARRTNRPSLALRSSCRTFVNSNARSSRGLLILPQAQEHLAEPLLTRPGGAALDALPADVNQLGDAVPAGAAGHGVFPVLEELLGLAARLADALLLLGVVVLVEVVDVLPRLLHRLLALVRELLGALRDGSVPALPPLLDDLGLVLLLLLGVGWGEAGVVADGRNGLNIAYAVSQDDGTQVPGNIGVSYWLLGRDVGELGLKGGLLVGVGATS